MAKKSSRTTPNQHRSPSTPSGGPTSSGSATFGGSATPSGKSGSATPSPNKDKTLLGAEIAAKLKGTSLEPLAPVIESLPKQLATLIEKKTNSMLSLYLELKEREVSLALYDKEVVNPETGENVAWRPKCCRKVNPITCSRYLKEDEKMQGIVKQFNDLAESFNTQGTYLMKRIAELEVNARVDSLREMIMETLHSVVNNFIIMEVVKGQYQHQNVTYTTLSHVLAIMVIEDVVDDFPTEQEVALYFEDTEDLTEARDHLITREDWNEEEITKNITMADQTLITTTKEIIQELFPLMTFELWQRKSQEDMLWKINSEQLIWNTKKEQELANEEVSMELDTETTVNETQMSNILAKMLKAKLAKKSKQIRKNYLADLKNNQRLTAAKNGSKQKSYLASALKNSNKNSRPQQQQQQSQKNPRQQE